MVTLGSLVSLSDLASFAVERCAAQMHGLYMYMTAPTRIAFRLNIYQQFEFAPCALLRAYEFLCFGVSFVRLSLHSWSWTPLSNLRNLYT